MPWLLLAGAALGLALSAWGLLEPRAARHVAGDAGDAGDPGEDRGRGDDRTRLEGALSEDEAAVVGERVIRRIDFERVLAGVERDLRSPIDGEARRRVLERMIDEELLVQQALALGLAAADRRVRGELVSGLVDSVVAEAAGDPPTPAEVEAHYRANADFFARPGRVRVETIFFSTSAGSARDRGAAGGRDAARDRAMRARDRLRAGANRAEVAAELGDREIAPVPASLLPLAKLRDYLGPRVVEALAGLETGGWSEPIESADGFILVRAAEREAPVAPPYAEVESLVRQDLVRRRGDEALRRYLDGLREGTNVVRNEAILAEDPR